LFSDLIVDGGAAVVAADHEHAKAFIDAAMSRKLRLIRVGRAGDEIRLREAAIDGFSQRLAIEYDGRARALRLPLVGEFQIENALVSAGLAIGTGSAADAVFAALEHLEGAKGRLELVGSKGGAPVFIDYAHKPDALEKALAALRPFVRRRLVVVFGAGGDRDPGKRPLMGEIATRLADDVIITDDNPRSEKPATIRAAIRAGAPGAKEIGDRAEAIRAAVDTLKSGDVLVVAGKGHETGQIVGDKTLPFSDHDAVAAALAGHA
jgi:UDP-N-acetylmuramoyl-L-alanyl-D-glutamate--2,6-diaminopimelate ligase